jgi:hypothetical protein
MESERLSAPDGPESAIFSSRSGLKPDHGGVDPGDRQDHRSGERDFDLDLRRREEQSAATKEVSSNINGVTQAAQETGHSASTVLELARSLLQDAGGLDQNVEHLLDSIRTA